MKLHAHLISPLLRAVACLGVSTLLAVAMLNTAGCGDEDVTLSEISITPASTSIALGTTQQLKATGIYSDNSKQDLTATVTWTSSKATVATVSSIAGSEGLATSAGVGSTTITAVLDGVSGSTTLMVTAAKLVSIAVTPTNPSIAMGSTQQFKATGIYSDKTNQDVTATVTWSSKKVSVATVSNTSGSNGLATSVATGTTTITATMGTVSSLTTLTVTAAKLASIAVTPTNPSIANGTTQQLKATGTYTDSSTQDLTTTVTWTSSKVTVATVSSTAGSEGLATGAATGSTTITATKGSISGSTTLTVTAAKLVSIAVTPTNPSIAKGTKQQLKATGTYSDKTTQDLTAAATWSSTNSSVAAVSSATGSEGLATSVATGSTTLKATKGGISGSTTLTVTAATLVSISVTPTNPSIAKGTKQQLKATGTYTDSSTQDLTTAATWTSTKISVAAVSNAAGSEGLATSVAVGTVAITATKGSVSGSTTLTVTAAMLVSISVTPTNSVIALGTKKQLQATGIYTDSTTQDLTTAVTWTSTKVSVAAVSNATGSVGLVTSVATGSTTVTATLGSMSGSTTLSVTAATLLSIAVTPTNASIALGIKKQFKATGTYSDSTTQDLTTTVTWSSTKVSVAAVSNAAGSNGLATSVATGGTTVTAALGSISGSTTLTVTAATLVSISVTPTNPSIVLGKKQQFKATGTYSDNSTLDLTASATWSSTKVSVATISNVSGSEGLATSVGGGSTTITATQSTISGTAALDVISCQNVGTAGPTMVLVPKPGGGAYCIDSSEVTRSQYSAFSKIVPSGQPQYCSWNTSYVPAQMSSGQCSSGEWPPGTKGNHPVVCVDWCDARMFCNWAGKRLCKATYSQYNDAATNEWYNVCSKAGVQTYPYPGTTYGPDLCNGGEHGLKATVPVKSMSGCVGGYKGIYDMSGNVWELTQACNGTTGASDLCRLSGGAYYTAQSAMMCTLFGGGFTRNHFQSALGFRCCADAK